MKSLGQHMNQTAMRTTFCRLVTIVLILALLSCGLPFAPSAFAETYEIDAEPDELQKRVEQSAQDYNRSVEALADLELQIEEVGMQLDELERTLPEQQELSGDAARALYRLQQDSYSVISFLLEAESIEDFIRSLEYVNRIQQHYLDEVNRLSAMKEELENTETTLGKKKQEAEAEKIRAEDALKEAQAAREEAQRRALEAQKAEEERLAKEKAEAEAAAAAAAAAAEASEQAAPEAPASTGTGQGTVAPPDPIDWSSDKQAFVAEWTPRIDAYLAGSPLSGTGTYFAAAAWDYGVDPRWSPAISFTESSKGAACFRPHNAWGWGSSSWDSWEEAIDAHVRGLARGYGYTISVAAAQKYCPPNWEHWYNTTSAQMDRI